MLLLINNLFQDRNQWLFIIFSAYLIIIFIFASIYYYLYSKYPGTFAFNADVLRKQTTDFKIATEHTIDNTVNEVNYFRHLLNALEKDKDILATDKQLFSNKEYIATSQYRYEFTQRTYSTGHPGASKTVYYISVIDSEDKQIAKHIIEARPQGREHAHKVITQLVDRLEKDVKEHRRKLDSLTSDLPEIWTFWDFLYFSTITQTTVGYGDILPNKTVVRILVILQIIIGLLMLGFLINIVFPNPTEKANG